MATILSLLPANAAACPTCVGNVQYAGSQLMMLAGITLLPFTLVAIIGWFIWRAGGKGSPMAQRPDNRNPSRRSPAKAARR